MSAAKILSVWILLGSVSVIFEGNNWGLLFKAAAVGEVILEFEFTEVFIAVTFVLKFSVEIALVTMSEVEALQLEFSFAALVDFLDTFLDL